MWLDGWMETPDEEFAEAMAMAAALWRPGQTQAVLGGSRAATLHV